MAKQLVRRILEDFCDALCQDVTITLPLEKIIEARQACTVGDLDVLKAIAEQFPINELFQLLSKPYTDSSASPPLAEERIPIDELIRKNHLPILDWLVSAGPVDLSANDFQLFKSLADERQFSVIRRLIEDVDQTVDLTFEHNWLLHQCIQQDNLAFLQWRLIEWPRISSCPACSFPMHPFLENQLELDHSILQLFVLHASPATLRWLSSAPELQDSAQPVIEYIVGESFYNNRPEVLESILKASPFQIDVTIHGQPFLKDLLAHSCLVSFQWLYTRWPALAESLPVWSGCEIPKMPAPDTETCDEYLKVVLRKSERVCADLDWFTLQFNPELSRVFNNAMLQQLFNEGNFDVIRWLFEHLEILHELLRVSKLAFESEALKRALPADLRKRLRGAMKLNELILRKCVPMYRNAACRQVADANLDVELSDLEKLVKDNTSLLQSKKARERHQRI